MKRLIILLAALMSSPSFAGVNYFAGFDKDILDPSKAMINSLEAGARIQALNASSAAKKAEIERQRILDAQAMEDARLREQQYQDGVARQQRYQDEAERVLALPKDQQKAGFAQLMIRYPEYAASIEKVMNLMHP